MGRPYATLRQINALGAHLVHRGLADIEDAGEMASSMIEAAGYDMSRLYTVGDLFRARDEAWNLCRVLTWD